MGGELNKVGLTARKVTVRFRALIQLTINSFCSPENWGLLKYQQVTVF
ncbi:hypothetical protein [Vibrio albus]|nr:hypothetical protein [Vibrio albus]